MSLETGITMMTSDDGVVFARTNLYLSGKNKTIDKSDIGLLVAMLAFYGEAHHNESEYCQ